ncbi:unnamed protein product [Haemonchus placei]|uniref:Cyclic lactone autoinducer peptide n=1 Tax=Haemonchus placei TaxID=6290 RepID=A0A0N4X4U8_HAEPC|nr:unnamed protein product [Haemonchus placei]
MRLGKIRKICRLLEIAGLFMMLPKNFKVLKRSISEKILRKPHQK